MTIGRCITGIHRTRRTCERYALLGVIRAKPQAAAACGLARVAGEVDERYEIVQAMGDDGCNEIVIVQHHPAEAQSD